MSASMEEMSGQIRKMMEPVFRKQNRVLLVAHILQGYMSHGPTHSVFDTVDEAIRVAELVLVKLDAKDKN